MTCAFCGVKFFAPTCHQKLGRMYCRRGCVGPVVKWDPWIAYLVGLVTSDGTLQKGGVKRVAISASDRPYLERVQALIPRSSIYGPVKNNYQLCAVWPNLYDFLVTVGLTPAKSLTLGALSVPDEHFMNFLRGVHDGDGHTHHDGYSVALRITSFAPVFRSWLSETLHRFGIESTQPPSQDELSISGDAVRKLIPLMWPENCFCLERKRPDPNRCRSKADAMSAHWAAVKAGKVERRHVRLDHDKDGRFIPGSGTVDLWVPPPPKPPTISKSERMKRQWELIRAGKLLRPGVTVLPGGQFKITRKSSGPKPRIPACGDRR